MLGLLGHIDFSYLLGDDPKRLNIEMKITEDMLNMLGGSASETFNVFKTQCVFYNVCLFCLFVPTTLCLRVIFSSSLSRES